MNTPFRVGLIIIGSFFILPLPAFAALQYVGGTSGSRAGSTSVGITLSLTALTGGASASAAAGDIVVVAVSTGATVSRAIGVTTSGYTKITQLYANSTGDTNLSVWYKIMGATPDTSVVTTASLSTAEGISATLEVWRNINQTTPFDVASTTATGTGTGRPTPPAITPVTSGARVIAIGAGATGTGAVYTTATLSNFLSATGSDTTDSITGMGWFAWVSGTYTPAQFGGGTTGSTDSWAAATLALRPATVPDAPTIGTATAGDAQASVTFTPPANDGGSAITGYTVTSTPGGFTGTGAGSPIVVTGLSNGTAYTFTVHATNAIGDSAESGSSNSVTLVSAGSAPTVTTDFAGGINFNSANLVGSITNTGGVDATQNGFAYGTDPTLATVIATSTLGGMVGTGSFNSGIGGLSAGVTYYFRAYATNTNGTGYGNILSFTAGTATPSRRMRLFEGFRIKIYGSKIMLLQQ